MSDFIHAIKQIVSGVKAFDENIKYQMICVLIAIPHLVFFIVFFVLGFSILYIYNFLVVVFYASLAVMIGKGQYYSFVFISSLTEILLHSSLATIMLGWNWGFVFYTLPLIPMSFYMAFTLSFLKKSIILPAAVSFIVCIFYFAVYGITSAIDSVYSSDYYADIARNMYLFNSIIIFFFLIISSILFAIEIRYMRHYLESENDSLSIIANYDPLTRLMNRRSASQFLKKVMEEPELDDGSFCLIMSDIDDFKKVNDTYGHSVGDVVLVNTAKVLQENVREEDFVCRWGGEEMLVFLRGNMEVSKIVADRICSDIRNNYIENNGSKINVTITIGVVEYKRGDSIRDMIETADRRLYRGKHEGKNRVVWR